MILFRERTEILMKPDGQATILAARAMAIFTEITKCKHASGAEDELRKYVCNFIQGLKNPAIKMVFYNPDGATPGERVIVVRKAAQNGGKRETKLVLQAHLDMVCNPSDMTFPLTTYTEEIDKVKWLKGRSNDGRPSTLGADDGIGVAVALAILEDTVIPVGQIECLFTVQEETDMGGAEQFDQNYLEGRLYLNLDSEDANIITYGSAGGMKSIFSFNPDYLPIPDQKMVLSKLSISGLAGGHSGVNIHEGRANGIQLMARVLFELYNHPTQTRDRLQKEGYHFNIITFDTSNKASNVIPMDATAVVAINPAELDRFKQSFVRLCETIKGEYLTTDQNFKCQAEVIADREYQTMLTTRHTGRLLNLLLSIPHGVLKMEPETIDPRNPVVQTSSNLAIINRENHDFKITCSHRSSSTSQLNWVRDIHQAIGLANGIAISNTSPYPAWTPDVESPLLKTAQKIYQAHYGESPLWQAAIIHAGLECSWVVAKFKDDSHPMDCISIGPTVKDPHTPNESLNLNSVVDFCTCLAGILTDLST
jgi:dipeptidase D